MALAMEARDGFRSLWPLFFSCNREFGFSTPCLRTCRWFQHRECYGLLVFIVYKTDAQQRAERYLTMFPVQFFRVLDRGAHSNVKLDHGVFAVIFDSLVW